MKNFRNHKLKMCLYVRGQKGGGGDKHVFFNFHIDRAAEDKQVKIDQNSTLHS